MIDRLVNTSLSNPINSDNSVKLQGEYKYSPDDFIVHEVLGFEPDQSGEHLYLYLEKVRLTTLDVAEHLARVFKVSLRDVGFSGMKDKQGVTRQWFSILTPDFDGERAESDLGDNQARICLIKKSRHRKKLRLSSHRANRFDIVIRNIHSGDSLTQEQLKSTLHRQCEQIRLRGFPNYFGPQRFGVHGKNVRRALEHLKNPQRRIKRKQRGIYLSALRSALFNRVLAMRVDENIWLKPLQGEPLILCGSRSFFLNGIDEDADSIAQRLAQCDISTSGPLVGVGELPADSCLEFEHRVLEPYAEICEALSDIGMRSDRRALRAVASDMDSEWVAPNKLKISFSLPPGSYASALIQSLASGFLESRS